MNWLFSGYTFLLEGSFHFDGEKNQYVIVILLSWTHFSLKKYIVNTLTQSEVFQKPRKSQSMKNFHKSCLYATFFLSFTDFFL